jgi:hypothetical protein
MTLELIPIADIHPHYFLPADSSVTDLNVFEFRNPF